MAITLVFFFWPAGQALYQSLFIQDAFGGNLQFVGLDNFRELFNDEHYLASFKVTAVFSRAGGRARSRPFRCVLAVFADRAVRGAAVYKTLLIWPYAVAPAIAGVLWVFLLNPTLGIVSFWLKRAGVDWNYVLNGEQACCWSSRPRCGSRSATTSCSSSPGCSRYRSRCSRRRRSTARGRSKRFCDHRVSAAVADDLFPARRQHHLRVLRHLRDHRRRDLGRPGQATEILVYKVYKDGFKGLDLGGSAAQSVVLIVIVITLTVVQFRYIERKVQY